jgi:hypothetical protein
MEAALTKRFPQGTRSKSVQDHLESMAFVCTPGKGPFLDRTGTMQTGTYIYCDRRVNAGIVDKRWQITLVTDADRITLISAGYAVYSAKAGPHPASTDAGRPGQYRLLESNDDAACKSFAKVLAAARSKSGDLDFSRRADKVSWRDFDPPLFDPPTQFADFDIDNDGLPDRVFRVAWSIGGKYTSALYIHRDAELSRPPPSDRDTILGILRTAPRIEFMEYSALIKRLQTQYGPHWEAWWMNGHALIEPILLTRQTYVIAWSYQVRPRYLANAYVFQVARDGSMRDMCMFARVCPCGGCTGRESIVEKRLLPDQRYCRRAS